MFNESHKVACFDWQLSKHYVVREHLSVEILVKGKDIPANPPNLSCLPERMIVAINLPMNYLNPFSKKKRNPVIKTTQAYYDTPMKKGTQGRWPLLFPVVHRAVLLSPVTHKHAHTPTADTAGHVTLFMA